MKIVAFTDIKKCYRALCVDKRIERFCWVKKENGIVAWQHEYVAVRPTGYKTVKIRLKKIG